MEFSSIALLHGGDPLCEKSASLSASTELQQLGIVLGCMNDALTQPRFVCLSGQAPALLCIQTFADLFKDWKVAVVLCVTVSP